MPALPVSDDMKTMWPVPRAAIRSPISRASTIGARRLTASARSISSTENDSTGRWPDRPALATRTSTPARSLREALDGGAVGEVDRHGLRAGLGGERLEHVGRGGR